jgi:putative tributyrin esterase
MGGANVEVISFFSPSLGRPMRYLALVPRDYESSASSRYPVLVLLHGGFGAPEDWLQQSRLQDYVRGLSVIVVMPQGDNSYYVNAAFEPKDRYEDYIINDLPAELEAHYRVSAGKAWAIAGISMGGFGALNVGLKRPERYAFVGSLSNAADAAARRFSFRHFSQSWRLRKTFGPDDSVIRNQKSPFFLIKSITDPGNLPFIYQACGTNDSLIDVNRRLDKALETAHIHHVYRESTGGHAWNYWDRAVKDMLEVFRQRGFGANSPHTGPSQ